MELRAWLIPLLGGVLALLIFGADMVLAPIGVAVGMWYVPVIVLGLWSTRAYALSAAFGSSILIGVDLAFATGELPVWVALVNRSLSVLLVWAVAAFVLYHKRRIEERMRAHAAANSALERSNQALQDFAHIAAHDLQEPLRKILAFGERLHIHAGIKLDESGRDSLARMQNAAARMQRLIEDLLAFSRLSTLRQPLRQISVGRVLAEVLSDLEIAVAESNTTIEIQSELGTIDAEPTQLRQLLQNLVGNALKFRDRARPHVIRVSATTVLRQGSEWYELSVSDNGIGFDAQHTERIFGLFQRLHGRDEYPGSGVGLAICRKIVEHHGGQLTATAKLGAGATFKMQIPLAKNATARSDQG